jgi:hypothetical protein
MSQEEIASQKSAKPGTGPVADFNSDPWHLRARRSGTPIFREIVRKMPHVIDFLAERDFPERTWVRAHASPGGAASAEPDDKCPVVREPGQP